MGILAECPSCHKKQGVMNRLCSCSEDLVKAKRSQKVKYWISYRLHCDKQRRESIGYSIEEAKAALGKRRSQKKENRIFEMLPGAKITFNELIEWYINLRNVKKLSSYKRVKIALNNFAGVFGHRLVTSIKPIELEDYQSKRETEGVAPATIDMEISITNTMVNKAFDNDMVDGHVVKTFRKVNRKLKKGSNARQRILSCEEYLKLISVAPPHLRAIIIVAYNTGMRCGELNATMVSY